MFELGELVVYGNKGVFRVEAIGLLDGAGMGDKEYYTLQSLYSASQVVYVPVKNQKAALRKIISKEKSLELINRLPCLDSLEVQNEKLREQKYRESMEKHDCEEWMKILKTLYDRAQERRMRGKKATSMDERYLHLAKKCLLEEFSVALALPEEEVERVIINKVQKMCPLN